jgi:hypothetical protein
VHKSATPKNAKKTFLDLIIMEDHPARCCEETTCTMKVVWCIVISCTVLMFTFFFVLMARLFAR